MHQLNTTRDEGKQIRLPYHFLIKAKLKADVNLIVEMNA